MEFAVPIHARPFVLDLGLVAAMEWQANEFQRRSGIDCDLESRE
jgi:signal transduction histidine kinase